MLLLGHGSFAIVFLNSVTGLVLLFISSFVSRVDYIVTNLEVLWFKICNQHQTSLTLTIYLFFLKHVIVHLVYSTFHGRYWAIEFLPLNEAVASRAVLVIVSWSDGRAETLLEPAN